MDSPKDIDHLLTAVKEGTIVHLSHVNFHGEYNFTELNKTKVARFDLEKILNLKLDEVT